MNNIKNDSKIMDIKLQINKKRKQLEGVKKFSPITNCSIELDNIRSNIQVLSKYELILLKVKLNSYLMSARELGLISECIISGYNTFKIG